jgi:hypothetical protein
MSNIFLAKTARLFVPHAHRVVGEQQPGRDQRCATVYSDVKESRADPPARNAPTVVFLRSSHACPEPVLATEPCFIRQNDGKRMDRFFAPGGEQPDGFVAYAAEG